MTERRRRFETWSAGPDELLQGVGGDPGGSIIATGLRVPTLPTSTPSLRYLFMLAGFELPEGCRALIHGWRQLATLGVIAHDDSGDQTFFELEITSPTFRFADGNIAWALTCLGLNERGPAMEPPPFTGVEGISFRTSTSPALLYDVGTTLAGDGFYFDLDAYVPPFLGSPPGVAVAGFASVNDKRTTWSTPNAWRSLDIEVEGSGFYGLYASVAQTVGQTIPFASAINNVPGLDEYRFIAAFPPGSSISTDGVLYWRVGGALDVSIYDSTIESERATLSTFEHAKHMRSR